MFEWIEKHKKKIVVFVVLAIFVVPILIHISFKMPAISTFFEAEWTAGDILTYYGAVLSFLGTVVLGYLALWQNRIINEKSEEHTRLIEKLELTRNMPEFKVQHHVSNGNLMYLELMITNVSENIANDIVISEFEIRNNENTMIYKSPLPKTNRNHLYAGESMAISFENKELTGNDLTLSFRFVCTDKFKEKHTYQVLSLFNNPNDVGSLNRNFKIIEL